MSHWGILRWDQDNFETWILEASWKAVSEIQMNVASCGFIHVSLSLYIYSSYICITFSCI